MHGDPLGASPRPSSICAAGRPHASPRPCSRSRSRAPEAAARLGRRTTSEVAFAAHGWLTFHSARIRLGDHDAWGRDGAGACRRAGRSRLPGLSHHRWVPRTGDDVLGALRKLFDGSDWRSPANGDLASLLLFGSFASLAIAGMLHIDRRRLRELGEPWAALVAQTSVLPFVAIIAGRTRLDARGLWWRALLGLASYAAMLALHEWEMGVSPFQGVRDPKWRNRHHCAGGSHRGRPESRLGCSASQLRGRRTPGWAPPGRTAIATRFSPKSSLGREALLDLRCGRRSVLSLHVRVPVHGREFPSHDRWRPRHVGPAP
ncbi:MAG: hypothetical protein DRJ42_22675 [Deltaproteobacteria bacterium]|nr:MAG: hypothetical protein DRJ42_22675 [Deltaproteobacteria bacterium]